ncbi:hypothetical protein PENSPDRAFT_748175 [Peniophora sp. CONT]|nr:hypothetical protein PENSPDRAFT_748175 [Peniophora sp. CONT]
MPYPAHSPRRIRNYVSSGDGASSSRTSIDMAVTHEQQPVSSEAHHLVSFNEERFQQLEDHLSYGRASLSDWRKHFLLSAKNVATCKVDSHVFNKRQTPISAHSTCNGDFLYGLSEDDMAAQYSRGPAHRHRCLFKQAGRPLKLFSRYGAVYAKAHVLHRDVSGGNILIDDDDQGMLIDWDTGTLFEHYAAMIRVGRPIGTWQFISSDIQQGLYPRPQEFRDDQESFVHILFYHVLRYTAIAPDGPDKERLRAGMYTVFDEAVRAGNHGLGGWEKRHILLGLDPFSAQFIARQVKPLALACLMRELCKIFAPLYMLDHTFDEARFFMDPDEIRHKTEELATCHRRMESAQYLASRFRHWIYDYHMPGHPEVKWFPGDDASIDQYPATASSRFLNVLRPRNHSRSSSKARSRSSSTSSSDSDVPLMRNFLLNRKRAVEAENDAAPDAKVR